MTKDMTSGSPAKLIFGFAIPMFLGLLFQQFYSMMDTIIVGRCLGVNALAAVGSTGSVNFMIIGFCMGVCNGFAIPVAQRFGAKDQTGLRKFVANSVWLSIVFAVIMTIVTCILCRQIMTWMRTPADIFEDANTYIFIIFIGIPATYLYNLVSGIIRSLGDSRSPLFFLIVSSVLNIGLDFLFILTFHMGVAGAAWATVLSQLISAVLCTIVGVKNYPVMRQRLSSLFMKEWRSEAAAHLKIGFPMGFQMSVMCIGQLAMQAAVNRIGTSAIAGYTAANKADQLSVLVDNAVGIGIANYVAQNYGAGKMDRIKKGVWHCFLMLTAMNFAMGALLLLGQSFVVPMFVTNPTAEIMQYSKDYLFTVVPFYFFLGALLVYRTAIQSVGNTWAPFAACVIELAARILCASVLSVPFGYRAVCFATPFAWLTALSLLIPVYIVLIRKLDGGQSTKTKT